MWHSFNWACVGVSVVMVSYGMSTEGPEVATLVKGNTAFAMQLYSQVRSNQGNVVVSPHSLVSSLAMTYAGARGRTARQMEKALHFPTGTRTLHKSFSLLDGALSAGRTNEADEVRAGATDLPVIDSLNVASSFIN